MAWRDTAAEDNISIWFCPGSWHGDRKAFVIRDCANEATEGAGELQEGLVNTSGGCTPAPWGHKLPDVTLWTPPSGCSSVSLVRNQCFPEFCGPF